jgi:HSP20 family protein
MSDVTVQKVDDNARKTLPVFEQIEKRIDDVRRRAFELFEGRGRGFGHDLEDWLKAEQEVLGSLAAEVAENDTEFQYQIALPGFDAKEVEVTASPSEIIVHAQTKAEKKSEKSNVIQTEFSSNEVFRRFETSQPINVENIKATMDKGNLRIMAAKASAKGKTAAA